MENRCLVIGVGKMGQEHLKVMTKLAPQGLLGWAPSALQEKDVRDMGAAFSSAPLEHVLEEMAPSHVIVASPVETLAPVAIKLIKAGVRNILLEKPAAMDCAEGNDLKAHADEAGAKIYVGYNRRFYASVRTAQKMIRESGEDIESILFEFNEVIPAPEGPIKHVPEVRQRWLLANSLHVIDTAFLPVGLPDGAKSQFLQSGALGWHAAGSRFVGSGITVKGVSFAYHANWGAPGRWGFEWMTPSTRYIFRPLEKLAVVPRGRFEAEDVPLLDDLDSQYKPGVYLQNKAFLEGDEGAGLVSLEEALGLIPLGQEIAGYPRT